MSTLVAATPSSLHLSNTKATTLQVHLLLQGRDFLVAIREDGSNGGLLRKRMWIF